MQLLKEGEGCKKNNVYSWELCISICTRLYCTNFLLQEGHGRFEPRHRCAFPLILVLYIMCAYQRKNGESFITMQGVSKGIVWNIIWLLVATEPLANAFSAEQCGIMSSIMTAITPTIMAMYPTVFLVVCLVVLGLVTQVVHNLVLMLVFIPLLCPMYAQMGGNPYVLSMALTTPATSYTSALMFGESQMERSKPTSKVSSTLYFRWCYS